MINEAQIHYNQAKEYLDKVELLDQELQRAQHDYDMQKINVASVRARLMQVLEAKGIAKTIIKEYVDGDTEYSIEVKAQNSLYRMMKAKEEVKELLIRRYDLERKILGQIQSETNRMI